jgi:hypothetical protein
MNKQLVTIVTARFFTLFSLSVIPLKAEEK